MGISTMEKLVIAIAVATRPHLKSIKGDRREFNVYSGFTFHSS